MSHIFASCIRCANVPLCRRVRAPPWSWCTASPRPPPACCWTQSRCAPLLPVWQLLVVLSLQLGVLQPQAATTPARLADLLPPLHSTPTLSAGLAAGPLAGADGGAAQGLRRPAVPPLCGRAGGHQQALLLPGPHLAGAGGHPGQDAGALFVQQAVGALHSYCVGLLSAHRRQPALVHDSFHSMRLACGSPTADWPPATVSGLPCRSAASRRRAPSPRRRRSRWRR